MTKEKEGGATRVEISDAPTERVLSFDEALSLPQDKIQPGLKVKGKVSPFGGSWIYDPKSDELTLREPATKS